MKQNILVTGATGNVGSALVTLLQEAQQSVKAAVREVAQARPVLGEDVDYVVFDFDRPESFPAAFEGVTHLFLVRPPALSDASRHIYPVIDFAGKAGVEQIVFLSLIGVEKNPLIPHFHIEKRIKASGIPFTFLRAGFFMQNLNTFYRDDIKQRHEIFLPAGKGKTSFIDVRDIAAVAVKAFTEEGHRHKAYPLTGREALDYFQVAEIFTRVLGREITYANPSDRQYRQRMKERGIPDEFNKVMSNLYRVVRWGGAAGVTPDTEKLLGRPPRSMEQYVRDYRECWL